LNFRYRTKIVQETPHATTDEDYAILQDWKTRIDVSQAQLTAYYGQEEQLMQAQQQSGRPTRQKKKEEEEEEEVHTPQPAKPSQDAPLPPGLMLLATEVSSLSSPSSPSPSSASSSSASSSSPSSPPHEMSVKDTLDERNRLVRTCFEVTMVWNKARGTNLRHMQKTSKNLSVDAMFDTSHASLQQLKEVMFLFCLSVFL
jgi:hypothetical protein